MNHFYSDLRNPSPLVAACPSQVAPEARETNRCEETY